MYPVAGIKRVVNLHPAQLKNNTPANAPTRLGTRVPWTEQVLTLQPVVLASDLYVAWVVPPDSCRKTLGPCCCVDSQRCCLSLPSRRQALLRGARHRCLASTLWSAGPAHQSRRRRFLSLLPLWRLSNRAGPSSALNRMPGLVLAGRHCMRRRLPTQARTALSPLLWAAVLGTGIRAIMPRSSAGFGSRCFMAGTLLQRPACCALASSSTV